MIKSNSHFVYRYPIDVVKGCDYHNSKQYSDALGCQEVRTCDSSISQPFYDWPLWHGPTQSVSHGHLSGALPGVFPHRAVGAGHDRTGTITGGAVSDAVPGHLPPSGRKHPVSPDCPAHPT